MLKTDYLKLKKPEKTDLADIDDINANMDILDSKIEEVETEAKNKNGGNADTVDGKHASDFAKVNHTHSYLPLSGGELSGNLKMGGNNIELKTVEYDSGYGMDMIRGSITISATEIVGGKNEVYDKHNSVLRNFAKVSALDIEAKRVEAETLQGSGADVTNVNAVKLNGKNDTDFSLAGHTHTKNSITDFPEALPANGGNANTVGGYAVGKLMKDVGTFNVKDFNDLDINTVCNIQFPINMSQSGYHTPLGDVTVATWYNVITFGNDAGNRVTQIAALPYLHQRMTYVRYKHDSTWSDWAKINDGGNADTLDGKHATDFAKNDDLKNYLLTKSDDITATFTGTSTDVEATTYETAVAPNGVVVRQYDEGVYTGNKTELTALGIKGDGAKITNVNAVKLNGKSDTDFATAGHTHNYLSLSGGIVSGSVVHDVNSDVYFNERASGYSTVIGYRNADGELVTGIQKDNNDNIAIGAGAVKPSLMHTITSEIKITPNGEIVADNVTASLNRKVKKFTVSKGSWFRFAKNDKNSCGGIFVLTVGSGASNSSTTVFSASQQYSAGGNIECLLHSAFGGCVSKLRLVNQYGNYEQYIDFYVEEGTTGYTGDFEIQFFGKGWVIPDEIVAANVATGYTATEVSL